MTNVIEIQRITVVDEDEFGLFANEMSTMGVNAWGEDFEGYCHRMEYHECVHPPRYPLPAIPLRVVWPDDHGYVDMLFIEAQNHGEDDPYLVCCWDFYQGEFMDERTAWYGMYQHCYTDAQAEFYKSHGAWDYSAPVQYTGE